MIRKDKGELVCECDECGAEKYAGTLEFTDFIQDIKDDGWRIRKSGDQWEHFCEECSQET